jgi:hypothetical protein
MSNRAKDVFKTAISYSKAAQTLNQAVSGDLGLLLPSLVVAALSLELFFKSLYLLEYNKEFKVDGRYSHDFHSLFNLLPEVVKNSLEEYFNASIRERNMEDVDLLMTEHSITVPLGLSDNLRSWSGVFTKVRYIYDRPGHQVSMFFFPEIEQAVIRVIRERHPGISS